MASTAPESDTAKLAPGHRLFNIIEEAYRVFSYDKPKSIEVCEGCCMSSDIEADFFRPPIRELPYCYVRDWYCAAYEPKGIAKGTWGYLLPRIFEILASGNELSAAGIEVSLGRFDTGNPANWSNEEWKIIDEFQRQFLALEMEPGVTRLDDVACMFRLGGWFLTSLFDQVFSASDEKLALRLWNDWCFQHVPGRENIWITTFWEEANEAHVLAFYSSRQLHYRMEALTLSDSCDSELAAKAAAVAGVIRSRADWLS